MARPDGPGLGTMALTLTRRSGESVILEIEGDHGNVVITVGVNSIRGSNVRLFFDAPKCVKIRREELLPESVRDDA